jgi:HD-GYP domain-containing protein (c-di-GMP phosphodiesterase class II)
MTSDLYKAVSLDTLLPQTLPGVALFLKHRDSYVLYKSPTLQFTEKDRARLIEHGTEELYVYSGELSNYNQYVESNLPVFLHNENLPPKKRQEILCNASVNYVHEIYNLPSKHIKENLDRCRTLIKYILNDKLGTSMLLETLGGLVKHSSYTYVHSVQVSSYSIALHSHMFKLNEDELVDIGVGSVFHDYGKIYIPIDILDKPEKLTPLEFYEVKKHCEYGYDILKMLDIFSSTSLNIVRHHHEKINGKGYPEGLNGSEICRCAKIAAIADAYSALTTNRSYRNALDRDSALDIMCKEMEGSFDDQYLSCFSAMLSV